MAEVVASFVIEKLCDLILEEASLLYGVQTQVEWMEGELRQMKAFLQYAEANQANDGQAANWVRDVRDVANDAEDIIETYILKMNQRRGQVRHNFIGLVKKFRYLPLRLILHHNIGRQVEVVKRRLKELSDRRVTYGIQVKEAQEPPRVEIMANERRELALLTDINVVVGFEDDAEKIVDLLLDSKDQCFVISIVGMGGSGKTTLARTVCDHNRVKSSFGCCRVLASVSQTYNVNKILRDIAKVFVDRERLKRLDETELKDELREVLKMQRYLIILDDIWQPEVLAYIKPYFPDVMNGSRLMITTRFENVAQYADPLISPYMLRPFTEDESWELFHKIVFRCRDGSTVCTKELEQVGKMIVKRCGGLPLAVAVMAGFVATEPRRLLAWLEVLREVNWNNIPNGEVCIQILTLSYNNLPPYLKTCFLYLSCFPEDYRIEADQLTRLWIAEGLVSQEVSSREQGEQGRLVLEDVAEQWLEELNRRCLVQHVERLYDGGRISSFKIHDLLLDLCRKKMRESNFFFIRQQDVEQERRSVRRRLAFHPNEEGMVYNISQKVFAPKLRTLLTFFGDDDGFVSHVMKCDLQCMQRAKLLRVINLEGAGCRELPAAIGDIFHLRYLGLRCNKLQSIPSTVGNLRNLQTLDIRENESLKGLPSSVWALSSMRHLLVEYYHFQVGKIKLVNLQTLLFIKAGYWIRMSLATMRNLRHLKVTHLSLAHLPALVEAIDDLLLLRVLLLWGSHIPRKMLELPKHQHLEVLHLGGILVESEADYEREGTPYTREGLPPNLCYLCLNGSRLQQDPFSLLGKLPYLRELRLTGDVYVGEELECSEDSFPQLKELALSWLPRRMRRWTLELGAMRCLDEVVIVQCENLEVVPLDGLQHVKINGMPSKEFFVRTEAV